MKQMNKFMNVFLLVVSMSYTAQAQWMHGPGDGHRPGPGWGDRPGHGGPGHHQPPAPPHRPPPPPSYPPQRPPPRPPVPPPSYGSETKRIYVGRNVFSETLHLRQLGGLGPQYQGYEVVAVRVNLQSTYYNNQAMVQLVTNGQVVATAYNPNYQALLYPQHRLVLGQNAQTLQLAVSGTLFVDSVDVELRRAGYNPPPPPPNYGERIELNVYRSTFGSDRIDLTPMIDMYRYRGRAIESVQVTVNSRYNTGYVSLLINGYSMGQAAINPGYSQVATYRPAQPMVIGQSANMIVLQNQGDLTIEHVTIVLR